MEKPDYISREAWNAALVVDAGLLSGHRGLYVDDIARAIMAAVAEERNECAGRILSQRYVPLDMRTQLAAAIRKRGEP